MLRYDFISSNFTCALIRLQTGRQDVILYAMYSNTCIILPSTDVKT